MSEWRAMMSDKPYTDGAMRAARTLRMLIHNMRGNSAAADGALHPANERWLADVCEKDAAIITRETGDARLIEALEDAAQALECAAVYAEVRLSGPFDGTARGIRADARKARDVLAKIRPPVPEAWTDSTDPVSKEDT